MQTDTEFLKQVLPLPEQDSVYIVLSRSNTVLSRMVQTFTGSKYTHAALALDRDLDYMFSFGRRWARNPFIGCFHRENIREGAYAACATVPGAVIEVRVTPSQYDKIQSLIGDFLLNSHRYDYNYFGLAKQVVGRAHYEERKFFCSEFVFHVLSTCGVIAPPIERGCVRPQDFLWVGETIFEGNLHDYQSGIGCDPEDRSENENPSSSAAMSNVTHFSKFLETRNRSL